MWKRFYVLKILVTLSFCLNVCNAVSNVQGGAKQDKSSYFTLVVMPDTQVLTRLWPEVLAADVEWIIDRREKENIVFVSHVGDVVDQYRSPRQWETADRILGRLDGVVPYGVLPGNHDMPRSGDTSLFQKVFPAKRYSGFPWYVDNYRNNSNSCQLFSAAGLDFVILHIECNPDDKALQWVGACLKKYSNRRAIIVTHSYLECINRKAKVKKYGRVDRSSVSRSGKGNSPEQMWEKCFSKHGNVFMILCGHRRMIQAYRQTSIGKNGNRVYEIMSDYTAAKGGRSGRGGFMRLMRFYPGKNVIEVKTYSPAYDEYLQTSRLAPNRDAHEFILPYDMTGEKKSHEAPVSSVCPLGDKPKYMFLFVADGMGEPMVRGANDLSVAVRGRKLNMLSFPICRPTTTRSANAEVTDSAASGTALACGSKTNNACLGVSPSNDSLVSVAELAKRSGMKVGVISSVQINNATPAAFYAHVKSRRAYNQIFRQVFSSNLDFLAGGMPVYSLTGKKTARQTKDAIITGLSKAGFAVALDSKKQLDKLKPGKKALFLYGNPGEVMPYARNAWKYPEVPELADITRKAIELLENPKGFFIMVEGGRIDWANHGNNAAAGVYDTIAFDDAIGEALKFYQKYPKQTLIVVTSDHETGGVTYKPGNPQAVKILDHFTGVFKYFSPPAASDYEQYQQKIEEQFKLKTYLGDKTFSPSQIEQLKKAFNGIKAVPANTKNEKMVFVYEKNRNELSKITTKVICELAGFVYSSRGHTNADVSTRILGIGGELFKKPEHLDNTDIGEIMKALTLNVSETQAREKAE